MAGRWLLVFSADSRLLAAPDDNRADGPHGGVYLWETAGGREVRYIPRPDAKSVLCPLCFSTDGRMLAGWRDRTDKKAGEPCVLVVWEAATGRERFRLQTKEMKSWPSPFRRME